MITKIVRAVTTHSFLDVMGDTHVLVAGETYELLYKDAENFADMVALGKVVDIEIQEDMTVAGANLPRRLDQAALPASGTGATQIAVGELLVCRVGIAEVQTVTSDVLATGGTWTLAFGADETDPMDFDADIAAISLALNALDSVIAVGGVVVTGDDRTSTNATVVTFDVTAGDVAALVVDDSLLTGGGAITVSVAEDTAGSGTMYVVYNDATEGVLSVALA